MTIFDEATAVRKRAAGVYDAQADPRFAMVVGEGSSAPPAVNGGVLMATVLRAVLDSAPNPHPVATSANFLRVPRIGPAEVHVTWLKQGKTASTARAALVQGGAPVVDMSVTTGTVPGAPVAAGPLGADGPDGADGVAAADGESLSWTGRPPTFPDMADCVDLGRWPGTHGANGVAGFAAHVEVLLDPAVTGWRGSQPSGIPEMRGYFQLREPREPDAYLLALAVDGLPPVVFGLGATGWAPTVELTWHMRAGAGARPAAGRGALPACQRRLVRRGGGGVGFGRPSGRAEQAARQGRPRAAAADRPRRESGRRGRQGVAKSPSLPI
jgi:Thioesterase-like superfamily